MNLARDLFTAICVGVLATGGLVWAQENSPAFEFQSLMNQRFYEDHGSLMIEYSQLVFPPANLSQVSIDVVRKSGELVGEVAMRAQPSDHFSMFSFLTAQGTGMIKLEQAGDFVLRGKVNGQVVTQMPFSMAVEKGGDAFNPQTKYHRKGPWEELAFLYQDENSPEAAMQFCWWTNTRELPQGGSRNVSARLLRGSEEVAFTRSVVVSQSEWQFCLQDLMFTQDGGKRRVTAKALAQMDGDYTIALKTDKSDAFRSYSLSVKGGKIQPHPRSALDVQPHAGFLVPRMIDQLHSGRATNLLDLYWVSTK